MVHGLKKFKEYFEEYNDQYAFIGGTACDLIMNDLGAPFRATKDLDIVLIIEALDASFVKTFWQFIEDGGYIHREKLKEGKQLYRFSKPSQSDYPKMIELFCRKPNNIELNFDSELTPIHMDENVMSLSAILLNDAYYCLLVKSKQIMNGYSLIGIEAIILLKIKAWLDLKRRKEKGEQIDSRTIKKHKNDIFRLLANADPLSRMEITNQIQDDINHFLEQINNDQPNLKDLGLRNVSFNEMMHIIERIFVRTELN